MHPTDETGREGNGRDLADERRRRARSYGGFAEDYDRYRPGYPPEAVRWLAGSGSARVLELGAGTGKLTAILLGAGHDVVATDPAEPMLRHLRSAAGAARCAAARAEDIPFSSSSVDVVVAAQAFHWFDAERALPEIARVLRPGGVFGLVWTGGDWKVPWVRRLFALIEAPDLDAVDDPLEGSELFSTGDRRVFRHWQRFDRADLTGFVCSSSRAAIMTPDERARLASAVGDLYDSYGRGHDGMLMPWKTYCYRARVTGLANFRRESAPDGDEGLLIDFG